MEAKKVKNDEWLLSLIEGTYTASESGNSHLRIAFGTSPRGGNVIVRHTDAAVP
jgi:hypothetical protein